MAEWLAPPRVEREGFALWWSPGKGLWVGRKEGERALLCEMEEER